MQTIAERAATARTNFDVEAIRADFPVLGTRVHGKPLVYLDSGASAQKPRHVIDTMSEFLGGEYANIHRGVYYLSQRATDRYEGARDTVARFLGAPSSDGIVFTRNGTEAINLVAASWGRMFLEPGDEIVISELEHHANIVPWQLLAKEKDLKLRVAPITDRGELDLDAFRALVGERTRLVAVAHVSNVLGTIMPVEEIVAEARRVGAKVLLDGCQAAVHMPVDVSALDVDFYAVTGHKLYGPTGIGALYGKPDLLQAMPPYQGGGDMVDEVTFEETTFKDAPFRFEAGTPAIAEAIGLAAAIEYVQAIGFETVMAHEHDLLEYATARLTELPGLSIVGRAVDKASIISFAIEGAHAHDIGTIVDQAGVAVRAGNHCAQPLHDRFGVGTTTRASFAMYNTRAEVDALADALGQALEILQ